MARPSPYPPELRERTARMVAEIRPNYPTEWAAMKAVAAKLGIGAAETVRTWVRKAEVDAGRRPGLRSEEATEIKQLRAENAELRRANEILKAALAFFASMSDCWRSAGGHGPVNGHFVLPVGGQEFTPLVAIDMSPMAAR